jgi:two-component system nitrogen regulation sensor histidine kinase NtrY
VQKIVEQHGGRLELEDASPDNDGHRGAIVRISLPTAAPDATTAKAPGTTSDTTPDTKTENETPAHDRSAVARVG